jgi:hypothetical protein
LGVVFLFLASISLALISLALFCWAAFNQGDLSHTVLSSYALLNGNVQDFYDFNAAIVGGNDYLPTIYIVFAIWMIPLKILGLTTATSPGMLIFLNPAEVLWSKVLLLAAFFVAIYLIKQIAELLWPKDSRIKRLLPLVFATSPIAIFTIDIFSQYDIFGLVFILLGFKAFLKKDLIRFAAYFAVAISFKYFALAVFIPLLLIGYQRLRNLLILPLLALSLTVLELALYWNNDAFSGRIFTLAAGRATLASSQLLSLACLGIYVLGCIFLLVDRRGNRNDFERRAVFASALALGLLFQAVTWNPQWLLLVTPFFALTLGYVRRVRVSLAVESVLFVGYIWYCVHFWQNNVDGSMITRGALAEVFPTVQFRLAEIFPLWGVQPSWFAIRIYLLSPLVFLLIDLLIRGDEPKKVRSDSKLLAARLMLVVMLFIVPTVASSLMPTSLVAKAFNSSLSDRLTRVDVSASADQPFGELLPEGPVIQSFISSKESLRGVRVQFATYARLNKGTTTLSLEDHEGNLLGTRSIDNQSMIDNGWIDLILDREIDAQVKTLYMILTAEGTSPGSAITAWSTRRDLYSEGSLSVAGKTISSDLVFSTFHGR